MATLPKRYHLEAARRVERIAVRLWPETGPFSDTSQNWDDVWRLLWAARVTAGGLLDAGGAWDRAGVMDDLDFLSTLAVHRGRMALAEEQAEYLRRAGAPS